MIPISAMQSPFEQLLGDDFVQLPSAVRRVHSLRAPLTTVGRSDITAAQGFLAGLFLLGAGLPKAGGNVETSVRFIPHAQGERWERRFGDRRYKSSLSAGVGRDAGFLIERFGPFGLKFRLTPKDEGLNWSLGGWRFLGIPLPRWTVPRIDCRESGEGQRFLFDIDVAFPVIGWLLHYKGVLGEKP